MRIKVTNAKESNKSYQGGWKIPMPKRTTEVLKEDKTFVIKQNKCCHQRRLQMLMPKRITDTYTNENTVAIPNDWY